jgi:hypothetical protein
VRIMGVGGSGGKRIMAVGELWVRIMGGGGRAMGQKFPIF